MTLLKKIYWFLFVYDLNGTSEGGLQVHEEPFRKKLMRDTTLLVMFCYLALVFNTITPVFADMLAHTFWEKEHLMTVHKLYGKNHVQCEVANAEKQSGKDKSSGNAKTGTEDVLHLFYLTIYNFSNINFTKTAYLPYIFSCPVSYPDADFRPPKYHKLNFLD